MARDFDDMERVLDRHARRLAQGLGSLLVDLGQAIRRQAETFDEERPARRAHAAGPASPSQPSTATKSDLLREAAELGIRGRSKMTKADLERAIRARRRAAGAA